MTGGDNQDKMWLRACRLVVGKGDGLDLSGLRIKFATHKGDTETPNNAEITVYNLSDQTAARIRNEFTRVILSAGYETNLGIIFDGQIRQVRQARENGVDRTLEIIAADGDRAYNYATVNQTLAAGARPEDQVRACAQSMGDKGTATGHIATMGGQPLPRGKVMYGMARSYLRDAADGSGCDWSIQDGRLQVLSRRGYLPGEAVVLTHETGLIGAPEQTNDGIKVRCLINPRLRIGGRVKLNNASILTAKTELKIGSFNKAPRLESDGFYRIIKAEFTGDTHGNEWYADLLCLGLNQVNMKTLDEGR